MKGEVVQIEPTAPGEDWLVTSKTVQILNVGNIETCNTVIDFDMYKNETVAAVQIDYDSSGIHQMILVTNLDRVVSVGEKDSGMT